VSLFCCLAGVSDYNNNETSTPQFRACVNRFRLIIAKSSAMAPVLAARVVSFTSEDKVYKAENLLSPEGSKKWRAGRAGTAQEVVVLALEKPMRLSGVDIGNFGSALVEIQVGRREELLASDDGSGYVTLLPSCSFMSPLEARHGDHLSRVRMFKSDAFSAQHLGQRWDRVRLVVSQPFSKTLPCGLSFVNLSSPDKVSNGEKVKGDDPAAADRTLGGFRLRKEEDPAETPPSVGGLFKRKRLLAENGQSSPTTASLAARAKDATTTLASLALGRKPGEKEEPRPFYQLKDKKTPRARKASGKAEKPKGSKDKQGVAKPKALPRRDVLPGDEEAGGALGRAKKESEGKRKRSRSGESSKGSAAKKPALDVNRKTLPAVQFRSYNRLMEGVVLALSGYQNPTRGEGRRPTS